MAIFIITLASNTDQCILSPGFQTRSPFSLKRRQTNSFIPCIFMQLYIISKRRSSRGNSVIFSGALRKIQDLTKNIAGAHEMETSSDYGKVISVMVMATAGNYITGRTARRHSSQSTWRPPCSQTAAAQISIRAAKATVATARLTGVWPSDTIRFATK